MHTYTISTKEVIYYDIITMKLIVTHATSPIQLHKHRGGCIGDPVCDLVMIFKVLLVQGSASEGRCIVFCWKWIDHEMMPALRYCSTLNVNKV